MHAACMQSCPILLNGRRGIYAIRLNGNSIEIGQFLSIFLANNLKFENCNLVRHLIFLL